MRNMWAYNMGTDSQYHSQLYIHTEYLKKHQVTLYREPVTRSETRRVQLHIVCFFVYLSYSKSLNIDWSKMTTFEKKEFRVNNGAVYNCNKFSEYSLEK